MFVKVEVAKEGKEKRWSTLATRLLSFVCVERERERGERTRKR